MWLNKPLIAEPDLTPELKADMQRLHELTVWGRWLVSALLWLTIAPLSLWQLRRNLLILQDRFTWSGLRYSLIFHPLAAIGLTLCIGFSLSTLIWQSRNILWGLPKVECDRLKQTVLKIQQQGRSHPLWRWLYGTTLR
ncbi:MAG: hypothetical protein VKJ24_04505 [Synechococcales bacterium]|nr:hypothetical protein [Synechococcales bacterium]